MKAIRRFAARCALRAGKTPGCGRAGAAIAQIAARRKLEGKRVAQAARAF